MGNRGDEAGVAVGAQLGVRERGHLGGIVGVGQLAERGAALGAHVEGRPEHPADAEPGQRGCRVAGLAAGLAGRGEIGRRGGGWQVRERVQLATRLAHHHQRPDVAHLVRDHTCLPGHLPEQVRARVVVRADHDPAEVLAPQALEDLGGEVRPPEPHQEQLGHLALEGECPGGGRGVCGDRRRLAGAPLLGRGGDHRGQEGAPRRERLRSLRLVVLARPEQNARRRGARGRPDEHSDQQEASARHPPRLASALDDRELEPLGAGAVARCVDGPQGGAVLAGLERPASDAAAEGGGVAAGSLARAGRGCRSACSGCTCGSSRASRSAGGTARSACGRGGPAGRARS